MEKTKDISKAFAQFQSWADETVRKNGIQHYALEECRGWTPPWFGTDLGFGAWSLPTERNGKKRLNIHPFVIQQIYEEMYDFFKVLIENNMLNNMLEIGLGDFGGTSILFSQTFNSVTTIESRDVVFNRYMAANEELEILHNNTIIIADSRDIDIANMPVKEFDFIFIDGDHSYECARLDYEKYSPLVRKGGIVGFHDSRLKHFGSAQFVDSLRSKYDIKDIWYELAYGAGISYYKV